MGLELVIPLATLLVLLRMNRGVEYTLKLFAQAAALDWVRLFIFNQPNSPWDCHGPSGDLRNLKRNLRNIGIP